LFCLISEPRLTPLFQEEDSPQRLLMGLMVSELKDHLLRHLQGVEKKKIEQMVLDYISKLVGFAFLFSILPPPSPPVCNSQLAVQYIFQIRLLQIFCP